MLRGGMPVAGRPYQAPSQPLPAHPNPPDRPFPLAEQLQQYAQQPQGPPITALSHCSDTRVDSMAVPRPRSYGDRISEPGGSRIAADYLGAPPSSTQYCTYIEEYDSIPRYIRPSLLSVAQSKTTHQTSKVPFVLFVTPFAQLGPYECPAPKVDLSPYSPYFTHLRAPAWNWKSLSRTRPSVLRCSQCGAYANPYFVLSEAHGTCNLCQSPTQLPEFYQSAVMEHLRYIRTESEFCAQLKTPYNLAEALPALGNWCRPELLRGTIDYLTHTHTLPTRADPAFYMGAGYRNEQSDSNAPEIDEQRDFLQLDKVVEPRAWPGIVFVVDSTLPSLQSDFHSAVTTSIKHCLKSWPETTLDIAIVTFNHAEVQVWPVRDNLSSAETDVVQGVNILSDVVHPFLPASGARLFLRITAGQRENPCVDAYVDRISLLAQQLAAASDVNPGTTDNPCLAGISVALDLLESRSAARTTANPVRGGTVVLFTTSKPTKGYGASELSPALATSPIARSPSKETVNVYVPPPQSFALYDALARRCVVSGVSISVFGASVPRHHSGAVSASLLDCGAFGHLTRNTGGRICYYPKFTLNLEYEHLYYDLQRLFGHSQALAFDCSARVRVSKGLRVKAILCPWSSLINDSGGFGKDASGFTVPRLDGDTSVLFELEYQDANIESRYMYAQVAVAYTNWEGVRMLRVVNKRMAATQSLATLYRHSDVEPIFAYLARRAMLGALANDVKKKSLESITECLKELFFAYRINCSIYVSASQLILPEALKLLPIYVNALVKNKALRGNSPGDQTATALLNLLGSNLPRLLTTVYPRVYVLHRSYVAVDKENLGTVGLPSGFDSLVDIPRSTAASGEHLTNDGVYLMDAGGVFYVYVTQYVKPEVIEEILPDPRAAWAEGKAVPLNLPSPTKENGLGVRLHAILAEMRKERFEIPYTPSRLVLHQSAEEPEFFWNLVEDRVGPYDAYVTYLCSLHRMVAAMMDDS